MASQQSGSGGDFIGIHLKHLAEDGEKSHNQHIREPCRQRLQQHVGEKMAFDQLLLGSSASRKAGMPMVNMEISDTWEGSSG